VEEEAGWVGDVMALRKRHCRIVIVQTREDAESSRTKSTAGGRLGEAETMEDAISLSQVVS
jgi:hypothetical protein